MIFDLAEPRDDLRRKKTSKQEPRFDGMDMPDDVRTVSSDEPNIEEVKVEKKEKPLTTFKKWVKEMASKGKEKQLREYYGVDESDLVKVKQERKYKSIEKPYASMSNMGLQESVFKRQS